MMKGRRQKRWVWGLLAAWLLTTLYFPALALGAQSAAQPLGTAMAVASAVQSVQSTPLERLGGVDRYATAAKISQAGWAGTAEYAVLAAGMDENLVDALTAAPLAAKLKAPILLTQGTELNTYAKSELTRLGVKTVYVTSGTAVITQPVLDSLKAMQITVKPLGGKDRFETSVNMAKELEKVGASVSRIVVTTGTNNADALSVASIAAAKGMPILLTNLADLPPSVKAYLDGLVAEVSNSYIIGGTGVVGDTVKGLLPGQVERYAGLTRYDTNLEVLKHFAKELKYQATYVANGENSSMADALAGSALAAQSASPILLTRQELPASARDYAKLNLSPKVVALGGEGVVPAKVLSGLSSSMVLDETGVIKGGTDAAQPERITENVKITAANVTLKNVTADYSIYVQGDKATLSQVNVRGTVFLDPGERGTVNLDGVSAARVVVLSGAPNSIHLKNVTTDALNVASSTPVRVETSGTTSVSSTVVSSAAILDAVAGSFGKVEIAKLALALMTPDPANPSVVEAVVELRGNFTEAVTVSGQASVKAAANANIPQMNIAPESKEQKITLQGTFQTVNINKAGEVALAENAKVSSTVVNSGAILNAASGSFGQVEIAKTITGAAPGGAAVPGKPPVMPVVELRGTFDQKVLVSGQATVKAAVNANIAKVEIAPESKEQKIILDGTFAKVEVNKEAKVELGVNATVKDAVTNAKADFLVPQTAIVEKLDPKNTGTTANGGGNVNGTATAKDPTTEPVVVTPPATLSPAAGGGTSGGSGSSGGGSGSEPEVQTITVNSIPNVSVTVGRTKSVEVSTSPTDAAVSAVSSDTTVATVSASGHTLTVTAAHEVGSATITVTAAKSGYTGTTRTFTVAVTPDKPASFDLSSDTGSLYMGLGAFKDAYGNDITWADVTGKYGLDLVNSKVYLTDTNRTISNVPVATMQQIGSKKVTDSGSIPEELADMRGILAQNGLVLHLSDGDLSGIFSGAGTGGMFVGFNASTHTQVYAAMQGSYNGEPWAIDDMCPLPANLTQNPAPDTTAPVLQTTGVSGSSLTLTYDESLDGSSVPAAGDFAVIVNSAPATVSDVAVSGTTVALTLGSAVNTGDTVTVSYTKGTNPVQDAAGNPAANLAGSTVTNNTLAPSAPPATVSVDAGLAIEDSTHFKTINAAVQAVADGGTIEVAAGTYPEMVKNYYTITNPDSSIQTVFKSFTLQGPDWTGQSGPLVHIKPQMSAIDPAQGCDYLLDAQAQDSSHPVTVNVRNLWLDGSLGIAGGQTDSKFIEGIKLGYDVGGSITGNLITGTQSGFDALGGYAANNIDVSIDVTVSSNRFEQLTYYTGSVDSVLKLGAVNAIVSNNTMSGVTGAALDGIKKWYKGSTSITGNTFENFGPAGTTANATYGGAMVSGDMSPPLGYALNVTDYADAAISLTITGNTFTNVQGILADDRASGNLAFADFAAANTISGSWLAYGDKTHIHWLNDSQDPDQLNYVLMDSALLNMATPTIWLTPGTYAMMTEMVNPGTTVILNSTTMPAPPMPDVFLTLKNTSVPVYVTTGSGVTCSATP